MDLAMARQNFLNKYEYSAILEDFFTKSELIEFVKLLGVGHPDPNNLSERELARLLTGSSSNSRKTRLEELMIDKNPDIERHIALKKQINAWANEKKVVDTSAIVESLDLFTLEVVHDQVDNVRKLVSSEEPVGQELILEAVEELSKNVEVLQTERDALKSEIANRIDIHIQKRKSTYYSVTKAEINQYAQFGVFATIFLSLFGALAGLALGSLVALLQANIPTIAQATLRVLGWLSGAVSVVFLLLAITLFIFQFNSKKSWEAIN